MPRSRIVSTLSAPLRSWLDRKRGHPSTPAAPEVDPLLGVGQLLRRQREERALSLRQLASETRISTPVLEALERGWRDRLPEAAYLRTMLPLLEHHLALPPGSLEPALPRKPTDPESDWGSRRPSLLARFTPGSIEVFTTWQGTVLYAVVTAGLIYGINLQQQRLAAANQLTLRPVSPLPISAPDSRSDASGELLKAYPDLRPLQQAEQGVAMQRLREREARNTLPAGVLRLQLLSPSRVSLSSETGERSELEGVSGELVLQMQPPIRLQLEPAPSGPAVFWDGQPVSPQAGQRGRFRIPAAPAASSPPAPAAPRP
ncbi:helix-turn-helix domain-containing protein [Synechococcus sp. CS-1325]|uniref:helix-turn-helix domain-containing protein n=1 Tax=unclassified Synechococcus TaxID=2626047 RepID=UPI000DB1D7B0|nr:MULTISPECIES: helix-turn-helix transcriptional regulator [unclassified Synechococcus]PZU98548.1 MAG: transcriptional regulator [Cyanobium sp.]MCT0199104.1 helix-turn-helix domain-containing protein [Synechococcus sp. CS-1325]MCT0212570.1 helix-turn-helix domain-containing protein [Synechococcus sp. CS-1326]MCT0229951.1 helix-turn-helix domain-containing protein [Synechococcus sp. CS-1324]MCT0232086.1 helix-turn-helix domain-containing protein [Synechococcus sp. CS-1327]